MNPGLRMEQYTLKRPEQVLLVHALVEGEEDEIVIFRGFSSSLVRPTAFDPDVPVLPEDAEIQFIDILMGPYTPDSPRYIQKGMSWADVEELLQSFGIY
jgi:hypothetical protein